MAMTNCKDCGQEISERAASCVKCGCPLDDAPNGNGALNGAWAAVTRSRTPINLFAIAIMSCSAILGMSATQIESANSLIAFAYTLHVFIAVTGMFFVTILFCRNGVYHPDDLAKAKRDGVGDLGEDRPLMAAALIVLMMIGYGLYQYTR